MTRTLALVGIAYRLRRLPGLLRWRRVAEANRALAAVERDLARLRA